MEINSIRKKVQEILGAASEDEINSVSTDVYYSGNSDEILSDSDIITKLGEKFKQRQEVNLKKVTAEDPNMCPICKCTLKPVKLDREKKAVFCSKHFVVFPVREIRETN